MRKKDFMSLLKKQGDSVCYVRDIGKQITLVLNTKHVPGFGVVLWKGTDRQAAYREHEKYCRWISEESKSRNIS